MRRLVRDVEYVSRPRLSTLSYTGHRRVTRLPPRSAVVAFALADVFSLAELLRRQRGGTAVVLGALSPRARNAQVGMFQAGEVDYLVATDAIGMGLNMDLDHVAFARTTKFDGRGPRRLNAAEIAQIAGRAGRHMSHGSFGTTAEQGPLDPEMVEAVEAHRFDPLTRLNWRNIRLRFESITLLLKSLEERPIVPGLVRAREADDHHTLRTLARNHEVAELAVNPDAVRLLWEVCQIPDYRKVMTDSHTRLLGHCFLHLASAARRLPTAWIAAQMASLDRVDGDIDTLMTRIAHIRTWTYITHRGHWVPDATAWQERARAIEDRLSDALHERITQRFVDRRSAFLVRQLASGGQQAATISNAGEVCVEGAYVGRLDGLRFVPDAIDGVGARMLIAAAGRSLRQEVATRARWLCAESDDVFSIDHSGVLRWHGEPVGRLVAGDRIVSPRADPLIGHLLEGEARERIRQRLQTFLRAEIERRLAPLFAAQTLPLGGVGRGLVFQLTDGLGCLPTNEVSRQLKDLDPSDRTALSQLGLRFGVKSVYFQALLRADTMRFRALLWATQRGLPVPPLQSSRQLARLIEIDPALPASFYAAVGLRVLDGIALRPDRLEQLVGMTRRLARRGRFITGAELAAASGLEPPALRRLLSALGYQAVVYRGEEIFIARPHRRRESAGCRPRRPAAEGHPFAKLSELNLV
jgi:ATP-dependent RNA helicase SUPV3L1/SUV3